MTPFYPRQIQTTFSDIAMQSTIDIKSSAILASSFAFIANSVPSHALERFLDTTPVFHHFAISDPIFSEHLASIISKLKRLGLEWMQTLLHNFLEKLSKQNDRFLYKSLAAIITHFPDELIKEVIEFICTQEVPSKHLPLLSFLFSSVTNLNLSEVDLKNIPFVALDVLQNPTDHIQQEIESAFQIFGIQSKSFSTTFELDEQNKKLKIIVKELIPAQDSDDLLQMSVEPKVGRVSDTVLDISKYENIPSFYNMRLPIELLRPSPTNGSLILTSKITTLGLIASEHENEYVEILLSFITSENNDDKLPAICSSLGSCINSLTPSVKLAKLFNALVFMKQKSWFQTANIMQLIGKVTADTVEKLLTQTGVDLVIDLLLKMCANENEKVATEAPKVLSKFLRKQDVNRTILKIANDIDMYDETKFAHSIELLTYLIKKHKEADLNYLRYLVHIIIEVLPIYKDALATINSLFNFLALFDLSFLSLATSRRLAIKACNLAGSTVEMVTGIEWDFSLSPTNTVTIASAVPGNGSTMTTAANIAQSAITSNIMSKNKQKVQQYLELINSDLQTRNFDIISANTSIREEFLSGLLAAVRLIIVMPLESLTVHVVLHLASSVLKIFPYEAAKIYAKIWQKMSEEEQLSVLEEIARPVSNVRDFRAIAQWTTLLLFRYSQTATRLTRTRDVLHKLAYYALCHPEIIDDEGLLEFARFETIVVLDINTIKVVIDKIPSDRKTVLCSGLYQKYPDCYTKLFGDVPPQIVSENEQKYVEQRTLKIDYEADLKRDYTKEGDLNSPFVITQMRENCFTFEKEFLQTLLEHFVLSYNKNGLKTLFYYLRINKIALSFSDIDVPEIFAAITIQHMKSIKHSDCREFANRALKKYGNRDIAITAAIANPDTFIKDVSGDRITKRAITFIAMAIQKVALNVSDVLDFVLKAIAKPDPNDPSNFGDTEIRPKRYGTALVLANIACALIPTIPPEWVEKVINSMKENDGVAPLSVVTNFVLNACIKTSSTVDRLMFTKTNLFVKSTLKSPEMCNIYLALYYMEPKSKIMDKLHDTAYQFLQVNEPSVFASGVKLLNMCLSKAADQHQMEVVLKHGLPLVLDKIPMYFKISGVCQQVVLFLSNVMNKSTLIAQQQLILKAFDRIMPLPNSASFAALSMLLPRMLAIADQSNEVVSKIQNFSGYLFTSPGSLFLCKVHISITREEWERSKNSAGTESSDAVVVDRVTKFLDHAKEMEGHSFIDIIYEYIVFITNSLGLSDGLQFVVLQFHKHMPRFYYFFVALSRFLRKFKLLDVLQNQTEETADQENSFIFSLVAMLSSILTVKCHSTAVSLLKSKGDRRKAVELALFDEDCDESEKIISSL